MISSQPIRVDRAPSRAAAPHNRAAPAADRVTPVVGPLPLRATAHPNVTRLLQPWKSLHKIVFGYAMVGLVGTIAVIVVNGYLPADPPAPEPALEISPAALPDVEPPAVGIRQYMSSAPTAVRSASAIMFNAVPIDPSTRHDGGFAQAAVEAPLNGSDGIEKDADDVASSSCCAIGAVKASAKAAPMDMLVSASPNDRYDQFPNNPTGGRKYYTTSSVVNADDLQKIADVLRSSGQASAKTTITITSGDPTVVMSLRRAIDLTRVQK